MSKGTSSVPGTPPIPGFLGRIGNEIRYLTQPDWTLADVEAHYDSLAEHYDEVNEAAHSHFRRFTDALRLADLPDNADVLELFSRTGEGMAFFYQKGKVRTGTCVDVSHKMGEICRKQLEEAGLEDVRWLHMTDYALPLERETFNVVLFLETIEHVSRPQALLTELARVTRPGGTMVLSTPNVLWEPVHALAAITGLHHSEGPHRFIRYDRLVEMVKRAGFHITYRETNVLVPAGPEWLLRWGEGLEDRLRHSLMPWIGLRRMLICKR
jgi:ubiquinone/menaquinone biosynthesis C-methylase UbiE